MKSFNHLIYKTIVLPFIDRTKPQTIRREEMLTAIDIIISNCLLVIEKFGKLCLVLLLNFT